MVESSKRFNSDEEPAKKASNEFSPPEKAPETQTAKQAEDEFEVEDRLKKLGGVEPKKGPGQ